MKLLGEQWVVGSPVEDYDEKGDKGNHHIYKSLDAINSETFGDHRQLPRRIVDDILLSDTRTIWDEISTYPTIYGLPAGKLNLWPPETIELLSNTVDGLNRTDQIVLRMRSSGSLQTDIALALGMTQGAVSVRLTKIRKRLRYIMERHDDMDWSAVWEHLGPWTDLIRIMVQHSHQTYAAMELNKIWKRSWTQSSIKYYWCKLFKLLEMPYKVTAGRLKWCGGTYSCENPPWPDMPGDLRRALIKEMKNTRWWMLGFRRSRHEDRRFK